MKTFISKDIHTCTLMFIAAVLIILKTGKQTKCQLMNDWIKKI